MLTVQFYCGEKVNLFKVKCVYYFNNIYCVKNYCNNMVKIQIFMLHILKKIIQHFLGSKI